MIIFRVDIRPILLQQLHNRFVFGRCRWMQHRSPANILHVDVCPVSKQQSHHHLVLRKYSEMRGCTVVKSSSMLMSALFSSSYLTFVWYPLCTALNKLTRGRLSRRGRWNFAYGEGFSAWSLTEVDCSLYESIVIFILSVLTMEKLRNVLAYSIMSHIFQTLTWYRKMSRTTQRLAKVILQ